MPSLDIIIETANLVAIFLEQAKRILIRKIFKPMRRRKTCCTASTNSRPLITPLAQARMSESM
jgi:hypothetical protein